MVHHEWTIFLHDCIGVNTVSERVDAKLNIRLNHVGTKQPMVHKYRPIDYHANIAKGEHSNAQSSARNPVQPSQETEIFIKNFKCNLYDVIPQIVVVVDIYLNTSYKYPRTQ